MADSRKVQIRLIITLTVADSGFPDRDWGHAKGGKGNLLLPPATKLRHGNIFTGVCQSFCSAWDGGGVCPSMHYRSHDRGVFFVRGSLLGRPPYRNERVVRVLVECILVRSNVPENA